MSGSLLGTLVAELPAVLADLLRHTEIVGVAVRSKPAPESVMYAYDQKEFKAKWGLDWLKPFGFVDDYAIAVAPQVAAKYHLTTISSLVPVAKDLTAGIDAECQNRPDCYSGLEKAYGLHFGSVLTMDHSLVYEVMASGKIQVTDAYTTDGALAKYHLVLLKDDKPFFPIYYAAPVVNGKWAAAHPQAVKVLNELAGKVSAKVMQQLNYDLDTGHETVQKVAKVWLTQQGVV